MYQTSAVVYHERLAGFTDSADYRVPVVDGTRMLVTLAGRPLERARLVELTRSIDVRTGISRRTARWADETGAEIEIVAERVLASAPDALLAIRLRIKSISFRGPITIRSMLDATQQSAAAGDDPRVGAPRTGNGLVTERVDSAGALPFLAQRAAGSDIWVAATQLHTWSEGIRRDASDGLDSQIVDTLQAEIVPGACVEIEKVIAYAWGRGSRDGRSTARGGGDGQPSIGAGIRRDRDGSSRGTRSMVAGRGCLHRRRPQCRPGPAVRLVLGLSIGEP